MRKNMSMNTEKNSIAKKVRVQRPERTQVEMQLLSLNQMLDKDHRARVVWQYVQSLDTTELYSNFVVGPNTKGRSGIDPEILLALWLMATIDSISSARELDRRCLTDIPYMWICGSVSVNYHTLSDFRSNNGEFLEKMLVDTVTAMMHAGQVTLETIGQDGMRVRDNAGSSSFRRQATLEQLHQEAEAHVKKLREEGADESQRVADTKRRDAAVKRAAEERAARIRESLEQVKELHEQREARKKGSGEAARCSTTDPEARNMKMGDGGFRPAFNVQFATDGDARVIVAVEVTNSGSDRGQMDQMHRKVVDTYGKTPSNQLVDSAFATKEDVTAVEQRGTKVISTVHGAESMKRRGNDPYAPKRGDTPEYAAFRQRMSLPENQELYKSRPSIAEFPNAECRNRGCHRFLVRGLRKVKAVMLLYASTFNLLRMIQLGAI